MPSLKRTKNVSEIPVGIKYTAKALQAISTTLTVAFAKTLFTTPIKYKLPKRESEMDKNSTQEFLHIPSIDKKIMTYSYGNSPKKVLLVHGWSGRGTQLVKIADKMLEMGYSTISFDAPAHGKSPGKQTLMIEFIASILEIDKKYGPFEFAIGHSLGSMSILNAVKQGLQVKKLVLVGSGDSVNDIVSDFIKKLELKPLIGEKMKTIFEKKYNEEMENYSSYKAAENISIPALVIHDKDDEDVPYTAGENIHKHLKNSKLILTKELGHRKILGDKKVIQEIANFLKEE